MKIEINENFITIDGIEYEKKEQPTPKEGEIWFVCTNTDSSYLYIYRDGFYLTSKYVDYGLEFEDITTSTKVVCYPYQIKNLRPATPEEIALLHTKLKENGKVWNPDTKTLEDYRELKVGELAIFWDDLHKEAIIAVLEIIEDGYYTNERLPYNNAIPFESIEQYEQFRKS